MSTPATAADLRLRPPAGFDDLTDYTFRSADGLRRLSVKHAAASRPPGVALADYLTRLVSLHGPEPATFEAIGVSPAPTPGAFTLQHIFAEESQEGDSRSLRHFRECCAFARLGEGTGLVVGFVTPITDPPDLTADSTFAHVLASVGGAAEVPGFTRRSVGPVSLDIPADLQPPTDFLFATPSADIRLSARVAAPGQPVAPPAYGSATQPPPGAVLRKLDTYPLASGDQMTMFSSARTGSAGPHTDYVCHGVVSLPDGTQVCLSGHCRWEAPGKAESLEVRKGRADRMARAFETLVASARGVRS